MSSEAASRALLDRLAAAPLVEHRGRVVQAFGATVRATGLQVRIGQACEILDPVSGNHIPAEVVGFNGDSAILTPLSPLHGLTIKAEVAALPSQAEIQAGPGLLGRVINAHGEPLDGLGPISGETRPQFIYASAPNPLHRTPIDRILATGVRAIDALTTVGIGQRVGIFSAAGAGKSTLLGMLGRHCKSEVTVIALIGERGREVRDFLDDALGPEGLKNAVVVVSTSDRPAMERVRAANAATAIAEYFRDEGMDVVLMMDSVTRLARALREVGLAVGEPAVRRGYPPSVFAELPRLFERAGTARRGSITAFYTVLLEEEDGSDPIGEEVRAILDGHIYLSRKLADAGCYPAIDAPASLSRLFLRLARAEHRQAASRMRSWISKYEEIEFLLQIGEYRAGGDKVADEAIARQEALRLFLNQSPSEASDLDETLAGLAEAAA